MLDVVQPDDVVDDQSWMKLFEGVQNVFRGSKSSSLVYSAEYKLMFFEECS